MRILVSGASGFVGSALVAVLESEGHQVLRLSRSAGPGTLCWNPSRGTIDDPGPEPIHAVVHLAGESVAGRWTAKKRDRILKSRVEGTRLLCETMTRWPSQPSTFVCASATGYYGDQGENVCTETSPPDHSFLAQVAEQWEAQTLLAEQAGIRTVRLRFGIILSGQGGALEPMIRMTWLGLAGPLGSGRQFWSWISLHDIVRMIQFSLDQPSLSGTFNAVSPQPIRQIEFARVLARVMRRPSFIPGPKFMLRAVLGSMADGLLLASCRAIPERMLLAGFTFDDPDLEPFLRQELGSG